MKVVVTIEYSFSDKEIKEIMQDDGYEDNEWKDEDEVYDFFFSNAEAFDLDRYAKDSTIDVEVEE